MWGGGAGVQPCFFFYSGLGAYLFIGLGVCIPYREIWNKEEQRWKIANKFPLGNLLDTLFC